MKKILVLITTLLFGVMMISTYSNAQGVVASNTPTVDKVLGAENTKTDNATQIEEDNAASQNGKTSFSQKQSSSATMAMAEQKVAKKGGEVLSLIQLVGYVVVSIILIIAIIRLAVVRGTGGANDPNLKTAGFGAIIICGVCYVLIYTGPFLLEWLKVWALS